MALTFGAAATDRVACGNAASINALPTFTICGWLFPTTLTSLRCIYGSRWDASNNSMIRLRLNGTIGNVDLTVKQLTADAQYVTNDQPVLNNTNSFVACTYDQAATPRIHIYRGTLSAILSESTYGTANNGTGNVTVATGGQFLIGDANVAATPGSVAFQGRISNLQIWNVVLTIDQLKALQFGRSPTMAGRVGYWELGYNDVSTQPDWSGNGNAGTVTGATQSQHVPQGPMFARSNGGMLYTSGGVVVATQQQLMMLGIGI